MADDLLFQIGEIQQGIVIIDRGEGIFAAKGQLIPIVAAVAVGADDDFFALDIIGAAAAAFMTMADSLHGTTLPGAEFYHHQ